MYILKQPYIGGEVSLHQDSTFLHTRPNRILGVWLALEDAHRENGCLWGIPGKYTGVPKKLFIRKGDACSFVGEKDQKWDLNQMVPLEVSKGSIIFFHGLFPHMSHANTSPHSRHAYSMHLMDRQDEFLSTNWIRPS